MTVDRHPLDVITGLQPDTEVSLVRVEVIDEHGASATPQRDVLSVVALGKVVELAAERLVRLRDVERQLEDSLAICKQLQSECELLRMELSRTEEVLSQVSGLQRRLQDVLDLP